jgi:hypothetical protein
MTWFDTIFLGSAGVIVVFMMYVIMSLAWSEGMGEPRAHRCWRITMLAAYIAAAAGVILIGQIIYMLVAGLPR